MSSTVQGSAKERILSLLDQNSFVEIGALVTKRSTDFNLNEKEAPADGVITGYGLINEKPVYVYSQDASALNGTMGEMHAKKIVNIYELALKVGAPVIGLIDCAGFRLQEATDALASFGSVYLKQTFASGVIPQITAILGSCGGGVAISSSLSDFTFMEETSAKLFVNSPNSITNNYIEKCNTSSATYQSEHGVVDGIGTREEIFSKIRDLVALLPGNNEEDSINECQDDINRVSEDLQNELEDPALLLTEIADNHKFVELKKDYAKDMVVGFLSLDGATVGAIANRSALYKEDKKEETFETVLSTNGCKKAADFINFCDAFQIPVVSFTNATGYKATMEEEKTIAKATAGLTYAFANATVPKINIVVGKAYGSAYITMNSKHIGADLVFAYPDAKIGMMDEKNAVQIMYAEEIKSAKDAVSFINEKANEYEALQSSCLSAAKRGYVDSIIDPKTTRKQLIYGFDMLYTKREYRPSKKHGTV